MKEKITKVIVECFKELINEVEEYGREFNADPNYFLALRELEKKIG